MALLLPRSPRAWDDEVEDAADEEEEEEEEDDDDDDDDDEEELSRDDDWREADSSKPVDGRSDRDRLRRSPRRAFASEMKVPVEMVCHALATTSARTRPSSVKASTVLTAPLQIAAADRNPAMGRKARTKIRIEQRPHIAKPTVVLRHMPMRRAAIGPPAHIVQSVLENAAGLLRPQVQLSRLVSKLRGKSWSLGGYIPWRISQHPRGPLEKVFAGLD